MRERDRKKQKKAAAVARKEFANRLSARHKSRQLRTGERFELLHKATDTITDATTTTTNATLISSASSLVVLSRQRNIVADVRLFDLAALFLRAVDPSKLPSLLICK